MLGLGNDLVPLPSDVPAAISIESRSHSYQSGWEQHAASGQDAVCSQARPGQIVSEPSKKAYAIVHVHSKKSEALSVLSED